MAHCGYEPTAAADATNNPLKALVVALRGVKTEGDFAPEIDLTHARKADYDLHEQHVAKVMKDIHTPTNVAAE
jgi:hypothetical protein